MEPLTTSNVITIVISIIGVLGVNGIAAHYWNKYFHNKDEKETSDTLKIKAQEKKERQDEIKEVLEEQLAPIQKSLDDLKLDNTLNKKGLQAVLRDRLYTLYKYVTEDRCEGDINKAYSTTEEKQNFENMYQNYHSLGVNGVMDTIYEHFMELPDYEPQIEIKSKKKKNI